MLTGDDITSATHGDVVVLETDTTTLPDDTATQARRVVAAYAEDADECRVFMSMLGIGPAKIEV